MGYETLKNIIDSNKEQAELEKQEIINPTQCPICAYTLIQENSKGEKSCEICGWRN
jgi:ribosomal protein L37AE/L43A